MGRKLRSIVAFLVVMVMLYCQQERFVDLAYAQEERMCLANAQENRKAFGVSGEGEEGAKLSGGTEQSFREEGGEMLPDEEDGRIPERNWENGKLPEDEDKGENRDKGKDGDKEEGEDKAEDEDKGEEQPSEGEEKPPEEVEGGGEEPPEEMVCFEIVIAPEDGENGYYITKPDVEICHMSIRGTTKYRFSDSDGQITEGELKQPEEKMRIEKEKFQEGTNHLSVWMEDETGGRIEEYTLERDFRIDTIAPVIRIQTPRGLDAWYQKEVFISVIGEDGEKGSQAEYITCFSENQLFGSSHQANAGFRIAQMSAKGNAVPVTIRIRDRAGNHAEQTVGIYIDSQPPKASIEGVQNYMITSQPVEVNYLIEEENLIGQASASARWEDPQGKVTVMKAEEWKDTGNGIRACQTLTEDGIYQLSVEAKDQSGYGDNSSAQVIIDKENPVIGYVDQIDHQYLQSFCWNYPAEECIQDFTSYTYTITLDGKPYHMGDKVTREGSHALEIKAVDSAGNTGTAKAHFVIDHTPPQVIYKDVEEGETYEEEKEFQITLKNQEDFIDEIRVNGVLQKTSPRDKVYQYNVQDRKDYEISVKAYDKAGNQTTSRLKFQVVEKKSILEKIVKPVVQKISGSAESMKEKKSMDSGEEEGMAGEIVVAFGFVVVLIILGSGGMLWRRQEKKSHQ